MIHPRAPEGALCSVLLARNNCHGELEFFKNVLTFSLFIFYLPRFHDFSKYLRKVKSDNEALLELEGGCFVCVCVCACAYARATHVGR